MSLREIVTGLESHAARLYHLGGAPVRRSTLADANASRPAALFAELLALLMKQAHRGLRRKLASFCVKRINALPLSSSFQSTQLISLS